MKNTKGRILADETFPLCIVTESESFVDTIERARKALHEAIEIKYFYEGTSTLLIGHETVTATAGDVIVINPYEFHTTVDYGEEKGRYHLFMIPPDVFAEYADGGAELKHRLITGELSFMTKPPVTDRMKALLSAAIEEANQIEAHHRLALRGLMLALFAQLMRNGIEDTSGAPPRSSSARHYMLIEPALRHIRDAYNTHITVEGLAALCSVSKYHFCRVFKSVTGMTVTQYLNDYRLSIAETMLKNTAKPIAEIAWLCGFEDEGYFCRLYKKRFGTSAGKRRENHPKK
jgi:AraC-like DNA-binding protein